MAQLQFWVCIMAWESAEKNTDSQGLCWEVKVWNLQNVDKQATCEIYSKVLSLGSAVVEVQKDRIKRAGDTRKSS